MNRSHGTRRSTRTLCASRESSGERAGAVRCAWQANRGTAQGWDAACTSISPPLQYSTRNPSRMDLSFIYLFLARILSEDPFGYECKSYRQCIWFVPCAVCLGLQASVDCLLRDRWVGCSSAVYCGVRGSVSGVPGDAHTRTRSRCPKIPSAALPPNAALIVVLSPAAGSVASSAEHQ